MGFGSSSGLIETGTGPVEPIQRGSVQSSAKCQNQTLSPVLSPQYFFKKMDGTRPWQQ